MFNSHKREQTESLLSQATSNFILFNFEKDRSPLQFDEMRIAMYTFGKVCTHLDSFNSNSIFSSVLVLRVADCASLFSFALTVLKNSVNWINSEGNQSSKSFEYSSNNVFEANRMPSSLSSVKFVKKPNLP